MTSEQTGVFIKSDTVRTKREKSKTELTTEKFINRAREIHGDKYDYSKSDYKTLKTKLIII
jgi:DNA-binding transcriptional regulator YhcF (GntR family)